jgi:hypothetical protein
MEWIKLPGVDVTFVTKWNTSPTNYIRFLPRLFRYPSLVNVTLFLVFWAGIVPSHSKAKRDMALYNKGLKCHSVHQRAIRLHLQ